jgi:hypothetical protein
MDNNQLLEFIIDINFDILATTASRVVCFKF